MSVKELNREQLTELKQIYYCEEYIKNNVLENNASYGELADIDNLVSDNEIYEYYNDTMFVEEDFFCSCE